VSALQLRQGNKSRDYYRMRCFMFEAEVCCMRAHAHETLAREYAVDGLHSLATLENQKAADQAEAANDCAREALAIQSERNELP
jgi:hypothetical protein